MTRELCGSNGEREGATARRFRTLKGQRSGVLAVVVAVASLTLAACGSVSPNVANVGTTTSTTTASNGSGASGSSAVDFSNCMRSKGVPNYPDPNSAGETPKESAQQLGSATQRSRPRRTAASTYCRMAVTVRARPRSRR